MRSKRGIRLKLVSEAEAPVPVRATLHQVCHCLGVPSVPMLYRAYATVPEFLALHWQAFKAALESPQFYYLGTRLGAEAYTRAQSYCEIPDLASEFAQSQEFPGVNPSPGLPQVLDYYQYLDPLLLLITVAQMQAFEGPLGEAPANTPRNDHRTFCFAPQLASETEVSPAIQRIWEERRRSLNLAVVPDEHRALAAWPAIYERCWPALKPLLQSPLYADCQYRLGESAWTLVRELQIPVDSEISHLLERGLSQEQISFLVRMNESLMNSLTSLLLDVTFLRIAREGGSRATSHLLQPDKNEAPQSTSTTRAA